MAWPDKALLKQDPLALFDTDIKEGEDAARSIKLRDIFNILATEKLSDGQITRKYPDIQFDMIQKARAVMIAYNPGFYAACTKTWPGRYLHLIDACISKNLAPKLWQEFGRATHTDFENLSKKKDRHVWAWAECNTEDWAGHKHIDAIITRDLAMNGETEDLGLIAVKRAHDLLTQSARNGTIEMKNLPLVIQVRGRKPHEISALMHDNKDFILKNIRHRIRPYIYLSDRGILAGPTYQRLAENDWNQVLDMIGAQKKAGPAPR